MEYRKTVLINLLARKEWRCRHREQMWTQWRKERVGQMENIA